MKPLTARERRLLAVGLLIAAIGLAWLIVVGPLVGGFVDRAAERRDLRAAYQTNAKLVASLPALRAAAEAQDRTAARFTVNATSEAVAVEIFKDRIQHLSTDEGFAVKAIDDLQADTPAGFIKLRVDMTLTLTQLCELLRRLQNEEAYVAIDYLSISADRSFASGKLEPLDVRLELLTAWRAGRARS